MRQKKKCIASALAACLLVVSEGMCVYASAGSERNVSAGFASVIGNVSANYLPNGMWDVQDCADEKEAAGRREAAVWENAAVSGWGYTNLGIADTEAGLTIYALVKAAETAGGQQESGNAGNNDSDAAAAGEIVGLLPNGAACEILDVVDGWVHIRSGRAEGYVAGEHLAAGERALALARQNQSVTARVTTTGRLNVRKQPDTMHGSYGTVADGTIFEVLEILESGWVSILYGDGTRPAYVSGEFVQITSTLETALTVTELMYGKGVTDAGLAIAAEAVKYVGGPYVYGGVSLTNGTDCSGFTMLLYKQFGISLSHSARAQSRCGTEVSLDQLQPGDLVFYARESGIDHVALYIGNGQVCHASSPKVGIVISKIDYRTPFCARRLF